MNALDIKSRLDDISAHVEGIGFGRDCWHMRDLAVMPAHRKASERPTD
jgi:hypothetical protein